MVDFRQRVIDLTHELTERGYVDVHYMASGNFAHVFSAIKSDPVVQQQIAIKVLDINIHAPHPGVKEAIQHFHSVIHEISCMSKLSVYCGGSDFPIVRMFDYFDLKIRDNVFAAMELEYCAHGSLESYSRQLISDRVLDTIVTQVLTGLAAIDACNIIHRDIKPDNILVKSLDPLQVKIADFGLARIGDDIFLQPMYRKIPNFLGRYGAIYAPLRNDTRLRTKKSDGKVCGTPYFMAPELFKDRTCSPKSDVWSLAATVFVLMTGEMPKNMYKGESVAEFTTLMIDNPHPDWEVYDRVIKEKRFSDIKFWLSKLFEPNPIRRPSAIVAFGSFVSTVTVNRPPSNEEDSDWVELEDSISSESVGNTSLADAVIETYVPRLPQ